MRKFTLLWQVAHYIDRNHKFFGCPFSNQSTLDILGNLNHVIQTTPMVRGATYKAWMDIDGYGILKTLITVEKHPDGYWMVSECRA